MAGFACPIVTGSGTGTHDFDHEPGVLTELQVGSYVFSDVIYDAAAWRRTAPHASATRCSSTPASSATSIPASPPATPARRSFAMDRPAPVIVAGAPEGSLYDRFGDEFGKVVLPDPAARLPVGTLLVCSCRTATPT